MVLRCGPAERRLRSELQATALSLKNGWARESLILQLTEVRVRIKKEETDVKEIMHSHWLGTGYGVGKVCL